MPGKPGWCAVNGGGVFMMKVICVCAGIGITCVLTAAWLWLNWVFWIEILKTIK